MRFRNRDPQPKARRRLRMSTILYLAAMAIILTLASPLIIFLATSRQETITVDDRWRMTGPDVSKYLIGTEERGVYQATDTIYVLHFRSADVYNTLRPGATFCVQVTGYRFGLTSSFPNIYRVHHEGPCGG
jgi:hypothetical protein